MIKQILRKILPAKIVNLLIQVKSKISVVSLEGPVVQIYIDDGQTETFLGLNDYYSFLLAERKFTTTSTLRFYDQNGVEILKKKIKLGSLSSKTLSVRELFKENGIHSSFGLVTMQMKPWPNISQSFKRLGNSASHFFVFYKSAQHSIGHIHPSSVLSKNNKCSGEFVSNQFISSKNLKSVTLFQCNPSFNAVNVDHMLLDSSKLDQKALIASSTLLPPLSVRKIEFRVEDIKDVDSFGLRVNPLPTSNSKPMLMRVYANDVYSLSHS